MVSRAIDAGALQDNLTDIYGDNNRLVYLKDVLGLIDEQPTITLRGDPEYREYTCPNCCHKWLEDRDATDYPEYCPACGVSMRG